MISRKQRIRCAALMMLLFGCAAQAQQMMSVQVQKAPIRATPGFLGQMTGASEYGARVSVVQKQGDWIKIRNEKGLTGWVHQSALTKKKIKMTAGTQTAQTAASGDELALAGKGFNSDVEAQFRAQNADADFTWVDRMEKMEVAPEESAAFLKEGGVQ